MKASLMITCLGDGLFPEVGVAAVTVLRALGVEVRTPGRLVRQRPEDDAGMILVALDHLRPG